MCTTPVIFLFIAAIITCLFVIYETFLMAKDRQSLERKLKQANIIEEKLKFELRMLKVDLAEAWIIHYTQINKLKRVVNNLKGRST